MGHRGAGFLVRSPADEELRLALFAIEGEVNLVRLSLEVARLHGIGDGELGRLVAYLEVTEGGYFSLCPPDISKRQIAEVVQSLDPRLEWREGRREFG